MIKNLKKLAELRRKENNGGLSENETRELKGLEPDDEVKYIIFDRRINEERG